MYLKYLKNLLYNVHWYMYRGLYSYYKVNSPCCSGGKSVNNCINARGVRSVDL